MKTKLIEFKKLYLNKDYILEHKSTFIKIVLVLILLICVLFYFLKNEDEETLKKVSASSKKESSQISKEETTADIYVDISGAVNNPMLAVLSENSRVEDAIKAAGGVTENADLTNINRAEQLTDGQKIYIPSKGEKTISNSEITDTTTATSGITADGKVNINTASSTELQTINGVGPSTAEKIIDYRTQNGKFKTIEEIKNVNGIGDKIFEKLKESITV